MGRSISRRPSGFNYGYKPASYFEDLDPETIVVASILGEERRRDVRERLDSGDFDPAMWGEWLTESKLDDATRKLIGSRHPRFMGGEYLPQFAGEEIEIARVVMASVMQDVISVRARRSGERIYYRVVDEYESKYELAKSWSLKPLALEALIELIDGTNRVDDEKSSGLVFATIDWHLECLQDPGEMRHFISVDSSFYADLGRYYEEVIGAYFDENLEPDDLEVDAA